MTDSLNTFIGGLKKGRRFLLAPHVNPEGDAIGSVLAMASLLGRLKKRTLIVCEDPFPERLRGCLPSEQWNLVSEAARGGEVFDGLVVADCPTLERIGSVRELLGRNTKIFNIDHHISNQRFGDYNYVKPRAAACGEVVYDIFKKCGLNVTQEEAAALYVAISTDTGSFRYSNTTIHSHRIVAELLRTGIDIEKINEDLHGTYSLEKIQLYSRLLGRIQRTPDGLIAWASMTKQDLADTGSNHEDAEGFIDFVKYLQGVKFSFFLSEVGEPKKPEARVSLRCRDHYDVARVAQAFGGGGHMKAAGCTIWDTVEEASRQVLQEIRKVLSESQKTRKQALIKSR